MTKLVVLSVAALTFAAPCAWAAEGIPDAAIASVEHMSCKGVPNEIRVIVRNVKRAEGLITADLYADTEEGFLKKAGRIGRISVAAKAPLTVFCLAAPSAAPHAVAVYQDRNANKKFDKNGLGLPDEPYGVSNNPRMRFGPPKISEAVFHVDPSGAIADISLKK
ncbi:MAG: DUF2141 domain-containing protein [Parvularculaceae bacterium]